MVHQIFSFTSTELVPPYLPLDPIFNRYPLWCTVVAREYCRLEQNVRKNFLSRFTCQPHCKRVRPHPASHVWWKWGVTANKGTVLFTPVRLRDVKLRRQPQSSLTKASCTWIPTFWSKVYLVDLAPTNRLYLVLKASGVLQYYHCQSSGIPQPLSNPGRPKNHNRQLVSNGKLPPLASLLQFASFAILLYLLLQNLVQSSNPTQVQIYSLCSACQFCFVA